MRVGEGGLVMYLLCVWWGGKKREGAGETGLGPPREVLWRTFGRSGAVGWCVAGSPWASKYGRGYVAERVCVLVTVSP